jgi:hypothetical protein
MKLKIQLRVYLSYIIEHSLLPVALQRYHEQRKRRKDIFRSLVPHVPEEVSRGLICR